MLLFSFLGLLACSYAAVVPDVSPAIVNGNKAEPGEIPYLVSVQFKRNNQHFCGGSILNERFVLTAAHCILTLKAEDIQVVAGTVHLPEPHSVHAIKRIITHEGYNPSDSWTNDVAVMEVEQPFVKSNLVDFVTLIGPNDVVNTNDEAMVAGFGRLDVELPFSPDLLKATIYIADQEHCKEVHQKIRGSIYDSNICANDPNALKGACQSDSGGPLMVNGKQVGIVSWGVACGKPDYPTVYARVSYYLDWIKAHSS